MAKHNETGLKGEQLAEKFLAEKGFTICHRNWRYDHKEVDIIALHRGQLVFAEIKTRSSFDFGFPEESVGERKKSFLRAAATAYLEAFPHYGWVRFDIISILMQDGAVREIVHLEDAFY